MALDRQNRLNPTQVDATELLNPGEIINTMIDLRIQLSSTIKLIQTLENQVLFSWRKRMALIKQQLEDPSIPSSFQIAGASVLDILWQ